MSHETFPCDLCREDYPLSDLITFHHQQLCPTCYEDETTLCHCCGERIWVEDAIRDDSIDLCMRCYEREYTHCTQCDRLIPYDEAVYLDDDEDDPYCSACAEERSVRRIQSYYFKPVPLFHGNGTRFLGVELEIDRGGEDESNAVRLLELANAADENLYIKHDGSLDCGMELVTHPMTLDFHREEMPWEKILAEAVSMGYRSHQTRTCGLHVHVNRDSLGDTLTQQEESIARILFFVENHRNELLRFSRRTQEQMDHWAARYGRKNSPKEQMEHVKKQYAGRYTCVNLTNGTTIEFRLFRGTLRYNTLIATLQLVNEICSVALSCSDEEMAALTWGEFVGQLSETPELVTYLKERQLYVNDAVTGEEEI